MAPFGNTQIVPLSEVPDAELSAGSLQHENRNLKEPIVLVVDDEPLVADTLAAILSHAGYAAVTAYSGLSALGKAIALRPALVITDVAMPQMNGVELAIAVLKESFDCNVLLFSGHATQQDLAPAREAGHNLTLLSKPVPPAEMLKHVSKSLRNTDRAKRAAHLHSAIAPGALAETASTTSTPTAIMGDSESRHWKKVVMLKVFPAASLAVLISFTAASCAQTAPTTPTPPAAPVRADHAMVVSLHHDATDAGVEILHEGGNAVDAAVAVGFALAVVYPAAGNIGGGGFMLIRPASSKLAHGQPHFLDYREKAPAAASANMYLDAQGNVIPKMSTEGIKASGVPGTVAGLAYAEKTYGKLGLAKVMAPAIKLARDGYVLDEEIARGFHSSLLSKTPTSHRIFQRDGKFYAAGDLFKQPELARTLERIAANPDDFYKGKMAAEIAAFEAANNGLITAADMAAYQVKERTPLIGHYHGLEVLTAPPPSSGGIVLLETLNILSGYDLAKLGPDRSAPQVHYITEAFRRAFMDRTDYLGDPDFNTMPLTQMNDPAYAAAWRKTIDPEKPTPSAGLARPSGFLPDPPKILPDAHESPQTTHYSVVDADGNAVSTTYTLNFGFGSGVTVEGLGFLLNDEMDDFASKMGVPNGFGLIQGPANAIAPGKRPLSAMTPTIISEPGGCFGAGELPTGSKSPNVHCKPGKLRLVLGSPGGPTIISTVTNDLISVVDNGLDIQAAADAPRFHHQYLPDELQVEKNFPIDVVTALRAAGYTVRQRSALDEKADGTWGDSELIMVDPKTGELLGGQDQRHHFGKAAGY